MCGSFCVFFNESRVRMGFQNVIPAEVSLVCVVKPDEFWDKKVTHFCFWKEKDRLGFEVSASLAEGKPTLSSPCLGNIKEVNGRHKNTSRTYCNKIVVLMSVFLNMLLCVKPVL